jgi:hypothetical protein
VNDQLRRFGYLVAMIVNAVVLTIAHTVLDWGIPFLTPSFRDVLWAIDLSVGATIIANALFIVYDSAWFRHASQIVLDALALVTVYTLYRVFPFDFGMEWANTFAAVSMLLVMIAVGIALVVQTVQAMTDPRWWRDAPGSI